MNDHRPFGETSGSAVTPAMVVAALARAMGPMPLEDQPEDRLDAIDRWGDALEQGDEDEVDRLVRQSRADRSDGALSARLGLVLGENDALRPDGMIG